MTDGIFPGIIPEGIWYNYRTGILHHAIGNMVTNTINATYVRKMQYEGKVGCYNVKYTRGLPCILIGYIFLWNGVNDCSDFW